MPKFIDETGETTDETTDETEEVLEVHPKSCNTAKVWYDGPYIIGSARLIDGDEWTGQREFFIERCVKCDFAFMNYVSESIPASYEGASWNAKEGAFMYPRGETPVHLIGEPRRR